MSEKIKVSFSLNGKDTAVEAWPMARLLDVIREDAGLTGTKEGCGEGECGACSVVMNGRLVNSCLVPALQAEGAKLETVEGLESQGKLARIQEAFLKYGGAQCGICTPGMLLAARELLTHNPDPSEEDIREATSGNLCRCTGYMRIFESVVRTLKEDEGLGVPAPEPLDVSGIQEILP